MAFIYIILGMFLLVFGAVPALGVITVAFFVSLIIAVIAGYLHK